MCLLFFSLFLVTVLSNIVLRLRGLYFVDWNNWNDFEMDVHVYGKKNSSRSGDDSDNSSDRHSSSYNNIHQIGENGSICLLISSFSVLSSLHPNNVHFIIFCFFGTINTYNMILKAATRHCVCLSILYIYNSLLLLLPLLLLFLFLFIITVNIDTYIQAQSTRFSVLVESCAFASVSKSFIDMRMKKINDNTFAVMNITCSRILQHTTQHPYRHGASYYYSFFLYSVAHPASVDVLARCENTVCTVWVILMCAMFVYIIQDLVECVNRIPLNFIIIIIQSIYVCAL